MDSALRRKPVSRRINISTVTRTTATAFPAVDMADMAGMADMGDTARLSARTSIIIRADTSRIVGTTIMCQGITTFTVRAIADSGKRGVRTKKVSGRTSASSFVYFLLIMRMRN